MAVEPLPPRRQGLHDAWMRRVVSPSEEDLELLLAALTDANGEQLRERFTALLQLPPHPAIAKRAAEFLQRPSHSSLEIRPAYTMAALLILAWREQPFPETVAAGAIAGRTMLTWVVELLAQGPTLAPRLAEPDRNPRKAKAALKAAHAATSSGDTAAVVEAMTTAWRLSGDPALATWLLAVPEEVGSQLPPKVGKGSFEPWQAIAARRRAVDLGGLVARLPDGRAKDMAPKVQELLQWPPDPRVARGLIELLASPPSALDLIKPFWLDCWALLARHASDAQLDQLQDRFEHSGALMEVLGPVIGFARQLRHGRRDVVLGAKLPELPRVSGSLPSVTGTSGDELLRDIYKNPEDLELRAVYGDWLLERGDPRGELIALQLKTKRTGAETKRIKELIKDHYAHWLGPLSRILQKPSVRFEAGFPVEGWVGWSHDPAPTESDPRWSTFRALGIGNPNWFPPANMTQRLEVLLGVTDVRLVSGELALPRATRLALEATRHVTRAQTRAALTHERFPQLEHLYIDCRETEDLVALLDSPLGKALDTLSLNAFYYGSFQLPRRLFRKRGRATPGPRVVELSARHSLTSTLGNPCLRVTQTNRGTELHLHLRNLKEPRVLNSYPGIMLTLETLPKGLQRARIHLPKCDAVLTKRVHAALARAGLEVVEENWTRGA